MDWGMDLNIRRYSHWMGSSLVAACGIGGVLSLSLALDKLSWQGPSQTLSFIGKQSLSILVLHFSLQQNSFAVLLLRFEDDCICKISANGGCIYPHFHALKVFGTEKTTVHDLDYGLQASKLGNAAEVQIDRVTDGYPEKKRRPMILNSFIDSIVKVSNATAIVQTQEVLDVMSVCLAAEEAIRSKKTVRIQYLVQNGG